MKPLIPLIIILTGCQYLVKHEAKEHLGDMFPAAAIDELFNVSLVDPEHGRELCLSVSSGGVALPNEVYIDWSKLGGVMLCPSVRSSVLNPMLSVFLHGSPDEIFEPIVVSDSVKVCRLQTLWSWADKCFKNQHSVSSAVSNPIRAVQRMDSVALVISAFENSEFGLVFARASAASEASAIGNLIPFKFTDFFPDFFHAEDLA